MIRTRPWAFVEDAPLDRSACSRGSASTIATGPASGEASASPRSSGSCVDWPLDLSFLPPPVLELCPGCARREVDDIDQGLCLSCIAESAVVAPGTDGNRLTRAQVEISIDQLRQQRSEAQQRWRAKRRAARVA